MSIARALTFALTILPIASLLAEQTKTSEEAIRQAYIEAAKPVAAHERLKELAGSWNVTTKMFFGTGEPMVSSGTARGAMILGGRFLQLEMSLQGALESDSLTIMGFDRRTGEYTMVGYDTLGTYYVTAAGKAEPGNKQLSLRGSYAQPPTGRTQGYRFTFDGASGEQTMRLYFDTPGGEMLVMESILTRQKK